MPKGRMLNKKISYDEDVALLSLPATHLYTWCIPHLDIKGRIYADPQILKGMIVPYVKELTPVKIEKCIQEMINVGLVNVYGNDKRYMEFSGFIKNQNLREDREAESEIPNPTPAELQRNSSGTPAQVKLSKVKLSKDKVGFDFEEIWKRYPNKDGKKEAISHFNASVKTKEDWEAVNNALDNYLSSSKVKSGYIKNGSTWFNNWQDYINWKEPPQPDRRIA